MVSKLEVREVSFYCKIVKGERFLKLVSFTTPGFLVLPVLICIGGCRYGIRVEHSYSRAVGDRVIISGHFRNSHNKIQYPEQRKGSTTEQHLEILTKKQHNITKGNSTTT
jgi:hypothetical protein